MIHGQSARLFNFSALPTSKFKVLKLGSKYIPPPRVLSRYEIDNSLAQLGRNLAISQFDFQETQQISDPPAKKLKTTSSWIPRFEDNKIPDQIKTIISTLRQQIHVSWSAYSPSKHPQSYVHKQIQSLKELESIKFVQCDKNLGLAILNGQRYIQDILKMLSSSTYALISDEDLTTLDIAITARTTRLLHLLSRQEIKFLQDYDPRQTAIFHALPKLHKLNHLELKKYVDFPYRPIVANRDEQAQARISKILTQRLLPYLENYSTVIKNSGQVVSSIKHKKFKGRFITFDFSSLYTNIPLPLLYSTILEITQDASIVTLLKFICENNYFIFGSKTYRQTEGIAMGTSVAPVLANLLLGHTTDRIITSTITDIFYYGRFIDDGLLMLENTTDVIQTLRQACEPFSITFKQSNYSIEFLDLQILNIDSTIHTEIFQKPFNQYSYIPFESNHPPHTKSGWIKGELTRYARTCSTESSLVKIRNLFYERLLKRGYPYKFLAKQFSHSQVTTSKDNRLQRPEILIDKTQQFSENVLYFPIRFTPNKWLHKRLRYQLKEFNKNQYLPKRINIELSFSKSTNLGNLLMNSKLTTFQIQQQNTLFSN